MFLFKNMQVLRNGYQTDLTIILKTYNALFLLSGSVLKSKVSIICFERKFTNETLILLTPAPNASPNELGPDDVK